MANIENSDDLRVTMSPPLYLIRTNCFCYKIATMTAATITASIIATIDIIVFMLLISIFVSYDGSIIAIFVSLFAIWLIALYAIGLRRNNDIYMIPCIVAQIIFVVCLGGSAIVFAVFVPLIIVRVFTFENETAITNLFADLFSIDTLTVIAFTLTAILFAIELKFFCVLYNCYRLVKLQSSSTCPPTANNNNIDLMSNSANNHQPSEVA